MSQIFYLLLRTYVQIFTSASVIVVKYIFVLHTETVWQDFLHIDELEVNWWQFSLCFIFILSGRNYACRNVC